MKTGKKAERKYLTEAELKAFFSAIPVSESRDHLIFRLMSDMGFRVGEVVGEILTYTVEEANVRSDAEVLSKENGKAKIKVIIPGLKIEDTDFENNVIHVHGKGGKTRTLSMTPKIRLLLKEVIAGRGHGYVILNKSGEKLSVNGVTWLTNHYAKEAGLKINIHPHMFRHSYAIYFLKATMDINRLRKKMGHSSLETTQVYLEIVEEMEDDKPVEFGW